MKTPKICKTCELYAHCRHWNELPPSENGCNEWEIAMKIFINFTEQELKEFVHDNPDYQPPFI